MRAQLAPPGSRRDSPQASAHALLQASSFLCNSQALSTERLLKSIHRQRDERTRCSRRTPKQKETNLISDETAQQSALALYIDEMMEERELKNKEVAEALGYESGKIIRLVREGKMRLPLEQIPLLADAIGASRKSLMDTAIREYFPDAVRALIMAYGHDLTENEMAIIQLIREVSGGSDPSPGDGGLWEKLASEARQRSHRP